MARLIRAFVRDVNLFVDGVYNAFRRWPPPFGFQPCLAEIEGPFSTAGNDASNEKRTFESSNRLSELFGIEWGILWGRPTRKRTFARVLQRRYSPHRIIAPKENLITCQHCGHWHKIHTICGECYKKVREETEIIKKRLLSYNPFKGELPDKEAIVVYQGETAAADGSNPKDLFGNEQRIVEIDKPRPSWFSADLKKRWASVKPFVYKKPEE